MLGCVPLKAAGVMLLLVALTSCAATRWEDETESPVHTSDSDSSGSRPPVSGSTSSVGETPGLNTQQPVTVSSLLNQYFQQWRGTPYRFGGTTRDGIDCSAFSQQAMKSLGVPLERTTQQQLGQGVAIAAELTRPGDLVFFKTGETLNHVGVIVGPAKFMHASTSRGVTISRLDDNYWAARVIAYRRVIN